MSLLTSAGRVSAVAGGVPRASRAAQPQVVVGWECLAGLVPVPGTDTVPGRPEPAGLGVHKAPSAAVDVAGPRRAAVWRLRSARVHAADVHPAVLQQRPGRGWSHDGAREAGEAGARQGCVFPFLLVGSPAVLGARDPILRQGPWPVSLGHCPPTLCCRRWLWRPCCRLQGSLLTWCTKH